MPRQKDLKRLVRARMKKTGEAYTAARAQIVRKPKEFATLAGMSDEKVKEKTGCTWERWVHALDHYGAERMSHGDIAKLVRETYKVGPWWAQTVTVGYERIRGLRARGQKRDGSYQISKSRTFNVPVATLFDAWADARVRQRWLKDAGVKVRKATAPKSMRLGWSDGGIVAVGFFPKGEAKSSVAIEHTKLPDRATGDRIKHEWSAWFDALGEELGSRAT